ncbi:hypothetical protein EDE12_106139 [Methylosinus sp. sav-2]|uniref:hypothetical protein n=1 Tax=Methylosinus sp. sav-2 TaxID=2485168 RepID=UPI00047B6E5D|nr:hypothetical protein [Methylosinus sp. sav-2]TDX63994.1 hypothetical protein EDE12_106139 [Methylosinus sp. sav-2]
MAYDPSIPHWPRKLLPQSWGGAAVNGQLLGPLPFVGPPQSNVSPSGALSFRLDDIRLFDSPRGPTLATAAPRSGRVHLFRALYSRLDKGGAVYMPVMDWSRGPRARAGLPLFGPLSTHSDGSTYSDGSSYSQGAGDATIALAAAAQSWRVTIDVASTIVPEAGDWMSLGDRAYLLEGVWPSDTVAKRYEVALDRWLREAAAIGDVVEFADPFCRMVLQPKSRGQSFPLSLGRIGGASLEFIEAYWG